MGKKYTLSQQKARERQRAVTERIRRENADAAASALRETTAKKEADTEGCGTPAPAASAQSVVQTGPPSNEPPRFEAGPSETQTFVPVRDSSIATPVTPTKASSYPTAPQRDGSTDESASESADSEPADLVHEEPELKGKQAHFVTQSCTGTSEVSSAAPATTAPQILSAAKAAPKMTPTADATPVTGDSISTSTSSEALTVSGSSTTPAVAPYDLAASTEASSSLEESTSPNMPASRDASATPDASANPDASATPIVSATPYLSACPGASTSPASSSTPTAASPDVFASAGNAGSAGLGKVKPATPEDCTAADTTSDQPAQVELTCKDTVGMPVSISIHACALLQTCFHQSWIPESLQARVNAAASAGVSITAAVAALVTYWKH
ncbi:g11749 [Coccomyxa elongata]